jgi:hypothetical protein
MYKQYLYLFLIIIILSQPEILNLLSTTILGRLLLIGSVVLCASINSTMGFIYIFLIIGILSTNGILSNNVIGIEGMSLVTPENINTNTNENKNKNKGDREKTESLLKPKSSNDIPTISPVTIYEPEPSDPDIETFTAF